MALQPPRAEVKELTRFFCTAVDGCDDLFNAVSLDVESLKNMDGRKLGGWKATVDG